MPSPIAHMTNGRTAGADAASLLLNGLPYRIAGDGEANAFEKNDCWQWFDVAALSSERTTHCSIDAERVHAWRNINTTSIMDVYSQSLRRVFRERSLSHVEHSTCAKRNQFGP